jgi:hypothetical protein
MCDGEGLDSDHDIDVDSAEPHLFELMSREIIITIYCGSISLGGVARNRYHGFGDKVNQEGRRMDTRYVSQASTRISFPGSRSRYTK